MSTIKADNIATLAGVSTSMANAVNGSAKAWVNFNGTGTVAIRDSYNVSSITDITTGTYRTNFTTAMANANYGMSGCAGGTNSGAGTRFWVNQSNTSDALAPTAAGASFTTGYSDSTFADCSRISIAIFS